MDWAPNSFGWVACEQCDSAPQLSCAHFSKHPRWKVKITRDMVTNKWIHIKPRRKMQKSVRYNEGHALYLSVIARKEGTKRGYLSKKTTENSKWHEKFFALYQNVLFYFDTDQSARPSGIYLLEGCTCERVPALKVSTVGKDALDKLVSSTFLQHTSLIKARIIGALGRLSTYKAWTSPKEVKAKDKVS